MPPYDPSQQNYDDWARGIMSDAASFNSNTDIALLQQGTGWDNQIAAYNAQYDRRMLGYQQNDVGINQQLSNQMYGVNTARVGVNRDLANQMYGIDMARVGINQQGTQRDLGTEQALHGLRQQGFGLDDASLALQGKRLDLSDQAIAQAEREQRFQYGQDTRDLLDDLSQRGAVASDYSSRRTNALGQQLAFQLEADRRQTQGLGLDRGQLGIDQQRVGISRGTEGTQFANTMGHFNDQMQGYGLDRSALGAQNAAANRGFGLDLQGYGYQNQAANAGFGNQSQSIGTQYNAAEDRYRQQLVGNQIKQQAGLVGIGRRYA